MTAGGGRPAQAADDLADCRLAGELLQSGQYDQVAAFLRVAQTHSAQGGDTLLAHILDAARQLCLAGKQCRTEVEWHRQACQEAERREQELRQGLCTILDLVRKGQALGPLPKTLFSPQSEAKSMERTGLWSRIRNLLPGMSSKELTRQGSLVASVEASDLVWTGEAVALASVHRHQPPPAASSPKEASGKREQAPPSLVVYCLGPFRVYQDDQPVADWSSGKGKSIFKYLIAHRDRPIVKEILMELFWPDMAPDAARNNLNVAIYGLRQALRQTRPSYAHILFRDDCYLLNPDLCIWVDCHVFETHCATAQTLEERGDISAALREYRAAEALYGGEFLEEDRYEDWLVPRRQGLQDAYLGLLDRMSHYYYDMSDDAASIALCLKMLALDPCHEEAHRLLMRCYSRQGQPHLALRQYHLAVEALRQDLDVAPMPATVALYRQIRGRGQV